jgi:transmembrane sensor
MSDLTRSTDRRELWGEEATQWWVLLHGEGATPADRREFLTWVARSPERIEAYLRIERLMTVLRVATVRWPDTPAEALIRTARAAVEPATLSPTDARACPPPNPEHSAVRRSRAPRARLRAGAAAATVLLAAAIAGWLWLPGGAQIYRTRAGEERSILLADGSRVTLNAASAIAVDLRRHRRVIHLLRGEALFQVSHDPARPFDVHADGEVVRAIGTEFNIDLLAEDAAVTVLEGRVAVMSAAQARAPVRAALFAPGAGRAPGVAPRLERFPAPAGALILGVAQQVVITPHGLSAPRPVQDLTATTAWTRGQLVFEHRPLGEVVDELDRDGNQHIVIDSRALRARRVTGVIQLDDSRSLLEFLSDVPGVVIRRGSDGTSVVTLQPAHPPGMSGAQAGMNRAHR